MGRSASDGGSTSSWVDETVAEVDCTAGVCCEVRPGGLFVQKRGGLIGDGFPSALPPARMITVKVTFGAARHDVSVSSIATIRELKKLLVERTGLNPADQMLLYRGKERSNEEYLDRCRMKNKSRLVLLEHPASVERRHIEMQRCSRIESAIRAISNISSEVDKLADQVSTIEKSVSLGNKVAEVQITTLIELLMRHAVKLDSICAEGESMLQKNLQSKRVQKCVETLDVMKVSNAKVGSLRQTTKCTTAAAFHPSITTQWEFFD